MVRAEIIAGLALLGVALISKSNTGNPFVLSGSNFLRQANASSDTFEVMESGLNERQLQVQGERIANRKAFRERLRSQTDRNRGNTRTTGGAFQFKQLQSLLKLGFSSEQGISIVNQARNKGLPLQTFINQAQSNSL